MIEHQYVILKTNWGINIKICAEYTDFDNVYLKSGGVKIVDGLWLKYADKFLIKHKRFYAGDFPYLMKGLEIVQKSIINNSIYKNTLIIICDIQYNLCDFQEEGLIVAMIEWAAKAFDFEPPKINASFEKQENRYIFDFPNS